MRVYQRALELNRRLAQSCSVIERNDRDLFKQLKNAASSIVLNIAEGIGTSGGMREMRFQTALGSAREVKACLEVAEAWGYLSVEHTAVTAEADHVIGMLVKLVAVSGILCTASGGRHERNRPWTRN